MGAKCECFYCHEAFPVEDRIDGFDQGYRVGFLCPHCGWNIKDNLFLPCTRRAGLIMTGPVGKA
jgi:hypothetical protein